MKKTVPLVMYTDGARREIGEAEVDLDTGEMTAVITDADMESVVSVNIKTSISIRTDTDLSNIPSKVIPHIPVTFKGTIGSWNTVSEKEE